MLGLAAFNDRADSVGKSFSDMAEGKSVKTRKRSLECGALLSKVEKNELREHLVRFWVAAALMFDWRGFCEKFLRVILENSQKLGVRLV